MRTNGVVVFEPTLSDVTNFREIIEQVRIQNFFLVGAVEALDVSILRWFFIFSIVNLSLLALMLYSIRRIEKLFHYRRVSELFHIVHAAWVAGQMKANGKTTLPYALEEAG